MAQLVSCSKSILIHSITSPDPILQFNPHKSNVNCSIWNHNNQVIASCGNDGYVVLSHSSKSNVLLVLDDEQSIKKPLSTISFTQNSQYLASGGQDGIVKIWDLKKKGLLTNFKAHLSQINSVHWNSLDNLVASASNVGDIAIHDIATQLQIANFNLPSVKTPGFKVIRFLPYRKNLLASGSNDGSLTIWDITSRDILINFPIQHQSKVTALACSQQNENLICTAGIDQKVHFFEINQKKLIKTLQCENPLSALAFHSDGHTIAVGTLYGQINLYDLRTGNSIKFLRFGGYNHIQIDLNLKAMKTHQSTTWNSKGNLRMKKLTHQQQRTSLKTNQNCFKFYKIKINSKQTKMLKQESEKSSKNNTNPQVPPLPQENTKSNMLEEIKRETLLRLEQNKLQDQMSSQKPPQPEIPARGSARIESAGSIANQTKITFENYSSKIEDLSKKYEKSNSQSMMQKTDEYGTGFTENQKQQISQIIDEQTQEIKSYIRDQIGGLHIDMIRQFSIQQNDIQSMLEKYLVEQNILLQRIGQLEQENQQLKRNTY